MVLLFCWGFKNKTVKELRKNQHLTAKELSLVVKVDLKMIQKADGMKLKNVPEPLKSRITPVLKGNKVDRMPWL